MFLQAEKFGPEKATTLNTYVAMKSGMKNVSSSGNNSSAISRKSQERIVCHVFSTPICLVVCGVPYGCFFLVKNLILVLHALHYFYKVVAAAILFL